jgi:hypothetical protein
MKIPIVVNRDLINAGERVASHGDLKLGTDIELAPLLGDGMQQFVRRNRISIA